MLGVLVSRVTGRSVREIVQTEVLDPLGMADTKYFLSKGDSVVPLLDYWYSEKHDEKRDQ